MNRKLQIFVSSTFTDLIPERQAAVAAILKAGHIPAGMELFTAGDQSQMEVIKRWIDQSDVYMLILGGRYGSVEPESGVSYTELEFDYARGSGKPFFSVVVTDDSLESRVKTAGPSVIELDRRVELQLFRAKVLSHMSAFFSDEKDIKLAVYEGVLGFSTRDDLSGWVRSVDVPDIAALNNELALLRAERDRLLKVATSTPKISAGENNRLQDIIDVLDGIKVTVPVTAGVKEPVEHSLLTLFYLGKEAFANGVTNSAQGDAGEGFFYDTVAPKLQIHGLVANESVAGVRYRRSYLTKLGMDVLAEIDRRKLKAAVPPA